MMARYRTHAFFALLVFLFYVACKGAFKGYFSSDDLDNLAWTGQSPLSTFFAGLITPVLSATNFRPVGHFYFWALGRTAGLDFVPYVAVLHLLHLANAGLLWRVMAKLDLPWLARAAGVAFFAFHMAAFDAYFKPMYVFDVLCATFCLTSLLLWKPRNVGYGLLLFMVSYKSKELAVALPVVLFLYEYWLGERRWKSLLPYAALAAIFTAQALFLRSGRSDDYGIRLTPDSLWRTVDFYASALLRAPHAGFALLALPLFVKDRRLWFGLSMFVLFLAPIFAVPGRLFEAYLYLPLAGLAIAFATTVARWPLAAALLVVWLPLQYIELRKLRTGSIAEADAARAFTTKVQELGRKMKDLDTVVIDTYPSKMRRWGVEGALRLAFGRDDLQYVYLEDAEHADPADNAKLALLRWDPARNDLFVQSRTAAGDAPYIEFSAIAPVWQLRNGWYRGEGNFRWTQPAAKARLRKPAGATRFSVTANISPDYIKAVRKSTLIVRVEGEEIGRAVYTENGWLTDYFAVKPGPSDAIVTVELTVDPPFRPSNGDPRSLGLPIAAFGFR